MNIADCKISNDLLAGATDYENEIKLRNSFSFRTLCVIDDAERAQRKQHGIDRRKAKRQFEAFRF
jgi:hypothetical protein